MVQMSADISASLKAALQEKAPPNARRGLVDAAKAQSECTFSDLEGTLLGLWSPGFLSAFRAAGYHFHFLSADLIMEATY
jgi:alpha-acetolactate decarboxylase